MRVFVSYGRLDRVLASQLALEIQLFGNIVWFDEQLTGGEEWWARILREIRDCQIFVFCLSPASLDSKPCQLELRYAQALRKSVMPVSLVPLVQLNLPSNLQHVQAIEFLSVELLYRKALAASIRSIPLSPDLPVPLPPEPYLPLVEISEIEKRLDTEEITAGEQDAIFETLRESFSRPDGAEPARSALKKLRSYPQVTMHVALRIDSLLRLSSFAIRSDNFAALSKITTQVFDAPVLSTAFLAAEEAAFVTTSSGNTWLVKNDVNDASLFYRDEKLKPARIALHPSLPALFIVGRKDMVLRSTLATRDYLGNPYEHSLGIVLALDLSSTEVVVQITDFQQESHVPGAPKGDRSFIVRMDGPTGQIASGGGAFRSLDISPNGEKLAIGGDNLYCLLWDLRWQRIVGRLRYADPDSIRSINFHPNGIMLIAGDYKGRLVIWDLRTSEVISIFKAHEGKISSMSFSYDGTRFFTAGRDGLIKLWDASTFKLEAEVRNERGITTISVSPVGDTFVTADRNGVISVWGVDPLRKLGEVCQYQSKANALAWSDNASRIATGNNTGDFDIWAISK